MTYKEVVQQISDLNTIQGLVNIYQQVAAMRMRKIKSNVTRTREFYTELLDVYIQAQKAYVENPARTASSAPQQKKDRLALVMTANTGLYGSIVKEVFDLFVKENLNPATKTNQASDLAVAGRLGKSWMAIQGDKRDYKYFDLGDGATNLAYQLKEIFSYAGQYRNILVYHGVFKSITEQVPTVTTISREAKVANTSKNSALNNETYIFEPTLDLVLETFEEQFRHTFFDQSAYESALAKFGSRMVSLDSAVQNITKELTKNTLTSMKIKHRELNKKQINNLLGVSQWKK